jgi:hypothetical protein
MELIPILSLIILVATISTFILAVGAYILYKIREGKYKSTAAQPSTVQAELVSPVPIMAEQTLSRTVGGRTYTQERYPTREGYREPMYAPTQEGAPTMQPTYSQRQSAGPSYAEASRYQFERSAEQAAPPVPQTGYDRQPGAASRKFTRYTTAERVPEQQVKKTETKKEDKEGLKWR